MISNVSQFPPQLVNNNDTQKKEDHQGTGFLGWEVPPLEEVFNLVSWEKVPYFAYSVFLGKVSRIYDETYSKPQQDSDVCHTNKLAEFIKLLALGSGMLILGAACAVISSKFLPKIVSGSDTLLQRQENHKKAEKSESFYDYFKLKSKAILGTDPLQNRIAPLVNGVLYTSLTLGFTLCSFSLLKEAMVDY